MAIGLLVRRVCKFLIRGRRSARSALVQFAVRRCRLDCGTGGVAGWFSRFRNAPSSPIVLINGDGETTVEFLSDAISIRGCAAQREWVGHHHVGGVRDLAGGERLTLGGDDLGAFLALGPSRPWSEPEGPRALGNFSRGPSPPPAVQHSPATTTESFAEPTPADGVKRHALGSARTRRAVVRGVNASLVCLRGAKTCFC
jgi:hypothetical protein